MVLLESSHDGPNDGCHKDREGHPEDDAAPTSLLLEGLLLGLADLAVALEGLDSVHWLGSFWTTSWEKGRK